MRLQKARARGEEVMSEEAMMNQYDPRQQFIEGLERYVSGIENDDGLTRLADHVSKYHDRMPSDAYETVSAIVWPVRRFTNSYASASEVLRERFRQRSPDGKPAGSQHEKIPVPPRGH